VGSLGTGAKGITAGWGFSLALMTDGTVNSWGHNGNGQLGNGTGTPRSTPGAVTNLSGVKAIATDSNASHVLALLEDGTVKSWGLNQNGQLGDGTSSYERTTPVAVANLSGVTRIATGYSHSLALLEDGSVKSWGYNYSGQLGNGASGPNANRSTPGDVIGLTNVKSVSGGTSHSLAVLESGRVRSWGHNGSGALGNGTSGAGTDRNTPGAVKNLSNVKSIDGGNQFTIAATTE
jgi:alpha-tubulin suppressor-like RCC1 family protein